MEDQWSIRSIMVIGLREPREIMNMGLVCRDWYKIAKDILLSMPEAKKINSLTEAYRLGWPCVIKLHIDINKSEKKSLFPCMDIIGACVGKNRKELKRIANKDELAMTTFALATHERLGAGSPISLLSHWIIESISNMVINNEINVY